MKVSDRLGCVTGGSEGVSTGCRRHLSKIRRILSGFRRHYRGVLEGFGRRQVRYRGSDGFQGIFRDISGWFGHLEDLQRFSEALQERFRGFRRFSGAGFLRDFSRILGIFSVF